MFSGDTRKKVTFPGSTTRMKVTFDPEKSDLPCTNSRKEVTMHPEKGGFVNPRLTIRNYPEKGDLFQRFSERNCISRRSTNLPGEK
jgi:hypothetical protein